MRKLRRRPAEEIVEFQLTERAGEQIVSPQYLRNAHFMIVDYDRQLIGWRTIGLHDHKIAQLTRDVAVLLAGNEVDEGAGLFAGAKAPGEGAIEATRIPDGAVAARP